LNVNKDDIHPQKACKPNFNFLIETRHFKRDDGRIIDMEYHMKLNENRRKAVEHLKTLIEGITSLYIIQAFNKFIPDDYFVDEFSLKDFTPSDKIDWSVFEPTDKTLVKSSRWFSLVVKYVAEKYQYRYQHIHPTEIIERMERVKESKKSKLFHIDEYGQIHLVHWWC